MGLTFDGSIGDISERQLSFIQEVLENRGYNNTKVLIEPVGVAGDNYIATVKRIVVNGENGVFKMIAKIAPQDEMARMVSNTLCLFRTEHHIYTEILPKFQELEAIADIQEQEKLRFAACYGSYTEAPNEVILLEDLQISNFVMLDRFKSLSNECIKSILRNLAILHSLSYALKKKDTDKFNGMRDKLFDVWGSFAAAPHMLGYFDKIDKDTEMLIEGEERKRVLKGAITQALTLAAKAGTSEINSKYSVILQGDAWINNFMFKIDGETVQQSIMIDYQQSKVSSPVCDLLYMIFNCTDHQTRLEHFYGWIDYYHLELDRCLSNFGLKANYVYPRDQLDADMKRHGKMIFGLTVLFSGVMTMKSEDASKVKDAMLTNMDDISQSFGMNAFGQEQIMMFKTRVEGLIDSFLKFGLL